jgi:signal transduction histidine kinase
MEMKTESQLTFHKIIAEMHRVQWRMEEINEQGTMLKAFAEQMLQSPSSGEGKSKEDWTDQTRSCVFLANAHPVTDEDWHFVRATKALEPIFMEVSRRSHHILFMHIANRTGTTRGYPWKDVSVLPPHFKPTGYSFFYLADKRHNPERKTKWTEPYLCPLAQKWMITCASPVYVENEFRAVLGLDINLEEIFEPLNKILKMTPQGYAFLVSSRGNLVISSVEGMESLRGDDVLVNKEWNQKGTKSGYAIDDIRVDEVALSSGKAYLLHGSVECNGWRLHCVLPKGRRNTPRRINVPVRTDDPARSDHGESEKTLLPMMSFISSFSESLKQIEKLIEGTRIIGSGDLEHRITVERKDEIGLLAVSINKMASELEKRKTEVESVYRKISQMDRLSALGQLTAGIAHEINNPLSIISSYVQLLARNPNLHPDVLPDIQIVDEEIQRASGIIRKLLTFSGQSETGKGVVQVNEVLDNTLRLLRVQLRSQNITLVDLYDEALPLTAGSSTELQQAFLNILLNAVQAMAQGGRLEVATACTTSKGRAGRAGKEMIEVTISDTGPGIERDNLDRVFDPFFSLKPAGKGTGLGLSISYGIVKDHHGNIELKSRPGMGTRVRIVLPVEGVPGGGEML